MRTRLLAMLANLRHLLICRTTSVDLERVTERGRWRIRCRRCGWRSRGWSDDRHVRDHRITQAGDPARHRLATPARMIIDGRSVAVSSASFKPDVAWTQAYVDPEDGALLAFETETVDELRRGEHLRSQEWRGNRNIH